MKTNMELAKARDFGEIINDTFTFVKQNLKPLLKYFFIFCGFFLLATMATAALYQIHLFGAMNSYNPNSFDNDNPFSRVMSILSPVYFLHILFIVFTYTSIATMVLCYMAIYKQNNNATPTTEEMWGFIKYYFLKVLGSGIVIGILVLIASVFCLVPGIYLYPIMTLVLPIMVIENTSFGYAFNQSFRLIKDNWWSTFGVLVVIFIVLYVASMILVVPASLLSMGSLFLHFTRGDNTSKIVAVVVAVLQSVVYVFQILMTTAACMCYFSLTENKEGTGLLERINQFGTGEQQTDTTQEEY